MTAPELKPCPFCGGKAQIVSHRVLEDAEEAYVFCKSCGAHGEHYEDAYAPISDAKAAWNRRADLAAVQPAQAMIDDQERNYLHLHTAAFDVWRWFETTRPDLIGTLAEKLRDAVMGPRPFGCVEPQPAPRELTVWYGKMPESNGRENWTAILRPKVGDRTNGLLDGFCFARSEYPDRVRYEADRMRWIIGELTDKPHILAYDADLHSGYVKQPDPRDEVIARLVEATEQFLIEYDEVDLAVHEPKSLTDAVYEARAALAAAKAVQHG